MAKEMTPEEVYQKNRKIAKVLGVLSPIVFWGLLALSIFFVYLTFQNSVGNVAEICEMLDNDNLTGEELQANYNALCQKYGEWTIGTGSTGFTLKFVNIKQALFSGVMIASIIGFIVSFIGAFVIGKWLLPKMSKMFTDGNQDMVNMTILKNNKGE